MQMSFTGEFHKASENTPKPLMDKNLMVVNYLLSLQKPCYVNLPTRCFILVRTPNIALKS